MEVAMSPILLFLCQTAIAIAGPLAFWCVPVIRRNIPLVLIQIMFGIALSSSVLAWFVPTFSAVALPVASLERLSGMSWLGAAFFTFLTGLHLDVEELAGKTRTYLAIGVSSMVIPLIFGFGVGVWTIFYIPDLMGPNANSVSFVFAIGLSVSATALPVLGAILRETGLIRQKLGRLALGYAALNDVLLWILIIALLAMISASNSRVGTFATAIFSTLLYFGFMAFVARPLLARVFDHRFVANGDLADSHIVLASSILLASSLTTEALGLHYLIGAFAAGAIMPKSKREILRTLLEPVTVFVLLPFYFIVTGLKVTLQIGSGAMLFFFVISTLAATFGKILGTTIPARLAGHRWREALCLGALMQCKGFVEVVILNVLLDAGVISNAAFSALILMALITTALTLPLVNAIDTKVEVTTVACEPPAALLNSGNLIVQGHEGHEVSLAAQFNREEAAVKPPRSIGVS
jgi:Kef-type K+ transport system membrane component KefB